MENEADIKPDTQIVPRDPKGRVMKGAKLGKGRVKGSKNKATLLREAMENKVSIKLSKAGPKVVNKVIDQAIEEGCRTSQKMIMDRIVPVKKADDGDSHQGTSVQITISNLTRENLNDPVVIEGESELIEE